VRSVSSLLILTALWGSGPAAAKSPLTPVRLALIQEASVRGVRGLPVSLPPPVMLFPREDRLGDLLVKVFEQRVSLPVLGTITLRPGQLPAAVDKPQPEKLIHSGRIWEKILNGFERWSSVYQNSVQVVKLFD
jgi:hypothetical protein